MHKFLTTSLFFCSIVLFPMPQTWAGDAAKGYEVAKARCAQCHNVDKGGAFKQHPPSFQAIATYRTRDDIWGRIIAPSPHAGMPEVIWDMNPDEVQDILAYIISLDAG